MTDDKPLPDVEVFSVRNGPDRWRSGPWIQYAGQTGGAHFYRSEKAARRAASDADATILRGTITWEEVSQ